LSHVPRYITFMQLCKKCGEEPSNLQIWCKPCQHNYSKEYKVLQNYELNKTINRITYQKYLKVRWTPPEEKPKRVVSPRRPNQRSEKINRGS